jgi:hypothetical protein
MKAIEPLKPAYLQRTRSLCSDSVLLGNRLQCMLAVRLCPVRISMSVADDHTREGANELQAPLFNLKLPNRAAGVGLHPRGRALDMPDAINQERRYAGRRGLHASTSARSAGGGPARHWRVAALPANIDTLGRPRARTYTVRPRTGSSKPPVLSPASRGRLPVFSRISALPTHSFASLIL